MGTGLRGRAWCRFYNLPDQLCICLLLVGLLVPWDFLPTSPHPREDGCVVASEKRKLVSRSKAGKLWNCRIVKALLQLLKHFSVM